MDAIFTALTNFVNFVNDNILWGIPMILIILGAGIFMTIRTKFLQVRRFGTSVSSTIVPTVKEIVTGKKHAKNKKEKSISQFEAFSSAIAGTVGTGNIVGVAGAILSGGPGAVFWMWVSAFFGLITNYSETCLVFTSAAAIRRATCPVVLCTTSRTVLAGRAWLRYLPFAVPWLPLVWVWYR